MLLAIALATALEGSFDFYSHGPYDAAVPRPDKVLGYAPGERHTTYFEQETVVRALAEGASDRVTRVDFGKSTEGRPLRALVITSPDNKKRLEKIRRINEDIANGKVAPGDVPADQPVFVWINECIHGNESASFESAMWLAYTLAASQNRDIESLLRRTVVVLNPSYNPDGHERFVVWYNSLARGDAHRDAIEHQEGGFTNGRTNHYRFDLNRDRVSLSQVESRQEVAEYRRWNPQVYVDQHGQVGTYFFPPVAQSINTNVDRARYIELSTMLGKETADDFDGHGWRYFVRETFDLYYAGYLDSWTSLNGAIGMTHETDGGSEIRSEREDGSVVTLRDGMAKHFTSALAVLRGASKYRSKFLGSFAKLRQEAAQGAGLGDMKRIIVMGDVRVTKRLRKLLIDQGIESKEVSMEFQQQATSFYEASAKEVTVRPSSVVIDLAQPNGRLARALLEPGQDFEADFTKRQIEIREALRADDQYPFRDRPEFYDTTGWSLGLALGLDAYWSSETPEFVDGPSALDKAIVAGKVGAAIPYTDYEDAVAATLLLRQGVRVHTATKPMRVEGRELPAGTFLVFRDRNDQDSWRTFEEVCDGHVVETIALNTSFPDTGVVGPGSGSVEPLSRPEIAIVFGDQPNGSRFGSAWFVFEQVFKLPFTAISQRALAGDLRKYSAIVLPAGARPTTQLKEWVQAGGALIALGNDAVIGEGWIDIKRSKLKDDKDPTTLPGAIFQASFNPRSPLAYGYDPGRPVAVPLSGSTFYKQRKEGGAAVMFGDEPKPLSGWVWPDEGDALKGTVWLHDQPMGSGHVVWFAQDPTSRAMWPGTYKMLLNAVLMGRSRD